MSNQSRYHQCRVRVMAARLHRRRYRWDREMVMAELLLLLRRHHWDLERAMAELLLRRRCHWARENAMAALMLCRRCHWDREKVEPTLYPGGLE